MENKKPLSTFLTSGLYHGALAGCVSSLAFIALVIIFFGITLALIGSEIIFGLFMVGFVSFLYGFLPAMILACLFGLINGLVFYFLQGILINSTLAKIELLTKK